MGVCAVVGRVGSILIGSIGISSMYWFGGNGLYLILTVLSLVSAFAVFRMPYCTLGRPLDL